MAGPNLELFKFGMYLFFPLAIMIHYGDPQWYHDNVLPVRDQFLSPEQGTYKPPRTAADARAELAAIKAQRQAARDAQAGRDDGKENLTDKARSLLSSAKDHAKSANSTALMQEPSLRANGSLGSIRQLQQRRSEVAGVQRSSWRESWPEATQRHVDAQSKAHAQGDEATALAEEVQLYRLGEVSSAAHTASRSIHSPRRHATTNNAVKGDTHKCIMQMCRSSRDSSLPKEPDSSDTQADALQSCSGKPRDIMRVVVFLLMMATVALASTGTIWPPNEIGCQGLCGYRRPCTQDEYPYCYTAGICCDQPQLSKSRTRN